MFVTSFYYVGDTKNGNMVERSNIEEEQGATWLNKSKAFKVDVVGKGRSL